MTAWTAAAGPRRTSAGQRAGQPLTTVYLGWSMGTASWRTATPASVRDGREAVAAPYALPASFDPEAYQEARSRRALRRTRACFPPSPPGRAWPSGRPVTRQLAFSDRAASRPGLLKTMIVRELLDSRQVEFCCGWRCLPPCRTKRTCAKPALHLFPTPSLTGWCLIDRPTLPAPLVGTHGGRARPAAVVGLWTIATFGTWSRDVRPCLLEQDVFRRRCFLHRFRGHPVVARSGAPGGFRSECRRFGGARRAIQELGELARRDAPQPRRAWPTRHGCAPTLMKD